MSRPWPRSLSDSAGWTKFPSRTAVIAARSGRRADGSIDVGTEVECDAGTGTGFDAGTETGFGVGTEAACGVGAEAESDS